MLVASFEDIDRWSHEGILRSIHRMPASNPRFPSVPLPSLGDVKDGLQKSPGNRPTSYVRPSLRVADVQRWRLDLASIKSINVPDEEMPRYRLASGDILPCEGNSLDLVGRGAIWHNQVPDCVHQNHVILIRLNLEQALPEFVLDVINSSYGQAYFRSKAKQTTNLASINSREVASLPLPLPKITEQQAMAAELLASRRCRLSGPVCPVSVWAGETASGTSGIRLSASRRGPARLGLDQGWPVQRPSGETAACRSPTMLRAWPA